MLRTGNHTIHGTLTAENFGESTGIHTLHTHNMIGTQITAQAVLTAEITAHRGQMADHKRLRPGPEGFIVLPIHPIIADQGIGHHHTLPRVGRVGEDLLIAGHGRVEHHFTYTVLHGPDSFSMEHRAIGQNQRRFQLCIPPLFFLKIF